MPQCTPRYGFFESEKSSSGVPYAIFWPNQVTYGITVCVNALNSKDVARDSLIRVGICRCGPDRGGNGYIGVWFISDS